MELLECKGTSRALGSEILEWLSATTEVSSTATSWQWFRNAQASLIVSGAGSCTR